MKKFCLLLACALCGFISVNAQRLIPRQQGVEVITSVPLIKGEKVFSKEHWGAGVSLTRYLKRASYAFLLAEYEEQRLAYRDYEVPMHDVLLQVGYMPPLSSDKGKNIFAYLGGSSLGGYEELNEEKSLLPDGVTLLDRSRLVYEGRCIAPLSASSRIGSSLSSRLRGLRGLRGDRSSGLICIAFVPPLPWDCALTYRLKKNNEKETYEYALGCGAICRSELLSPCL